MNLFKMIVAVVLMLAVIGCSQDSGMEETIGDVVRESDMPAPTTAVVEEPESVEETSEPVVEMRSRSYEVIVNTKRFDPEDVIISAGDTVTWRKADNLNHRLVSDDLFHSGEQLYDDGDAYSVTFEESGMYEYRDVVFGARGTVTVK